MYFLFASAYIGACFALGYFGAGFIDKFWNR